MANNSKKPNKFVRVHRDDLKNGSDYYIRSMPTPKDCKNSKKK